MTEAIVLAVLSVAAGTLLALFPGQRAILLGPIRTFGLTASLGVVFLHLLPEALSAIGGWALVGLAGGIVAPDLLGRLGMLAWQVGHGAKARSELALEAGYFGLLIHHVGDGIGLGAYTGELHADDSHGGVVTALAAHVVPVVAIMVLAFDSVRGRGSAIVRAVGLALASILGVLLTHLVPPNFMETSGAWVTAGVAGLLVHVVTHDLTSQAPRTPGQRSLDLVVASAGIAVSLIGGVEHGAAHEGDPRAKVAAAFLDVAIDTGPMLLLGLIVGAAIYAFGTALPKALLRSGGVTWDGVRGALLGVPLPLSSKRVLPISDALKRRGAAPALVVAFLLATPELGVETLALSARFFGWPLALSRLLGALVLAVVAAWIVGWALGVSAQDESPVAALAEGSPESFAGGSRFARFVRAFDELMHHVGAWMLVGVVVAAFLQASLHEGALANADSPWLELCIVALVAVPSYVSAPAATPLAAVLVAKGLSPGAALLGLMLGSATNVAKLAFLRRSYGVRGLFWVGAVVVSVSFALALFVNAKVPVAMPPAWGAAGQERGAAWLALGGLCALVVLRSIWLSGTRAWLASLRSSADGHGHDAHGHGHGHAH